MVQTKFTVADFGLSSSWIGYNQGSGPYYSNPTTASSNKIFSISGISPEAVIDSAMLTVTLGSPYTGAALRHVDGESFSGSRDVTDKITAKNGNYSGGVSFAFKFRANGEQGSVSSAGSSHTSSLVFSDVTLAITYHMPGSSLTVPSQTDAAVAFTAGIDASSSAYSHGIVLSIGSHTGTEISVASGKTAYSVSFPPEWLDAIPNANSVTGTVTLKTYNGSTLLDKTSKAITVKVPASATPLISCSAPVHVRGIVPEAWNKYVKGKSKVTLSGTATAQYGASIASVVIGGDASGSATIAGNTFTFTSGYLSRLDVNTFTVAVTDSRGKKSTATFNTITVQDYFLPGIESPSIFRCTSTEAPSDNGKNIYVKGTFRFASVDSKNSVTGKAYYRQMPSGSWLPAGGVAILSGEYKLLGGDALSDKSSYQAKIVIQDGLYPGVAATEYVEDIGTAGCLFDAYKKERFALFKYAEYDGFEVGQDKEIRYKGETLDQRFPKAIDSRIKVYTSPSQFGLAVTDSTTLEQISLAMPNGSELIYVPPNTITSNMSPSSDRSGTLRLIRTTIGVPRLVAEFYSAASNNRVYRYDLYSSDGGETWRSAGWYQIWHSAAAIPLSGGGTGATDKATAKSNLGFSSGTGSPSGGVDGDIYFKYV